MSVTIKTPGEIELMREAGRILALVHEELGKIIEPGISTYEIDKEGERLIRSFSCIPSFLNYNGYPASICVSVNEEVVHGIPSRKRILKEGDIVSLDAGVIYKGYHSDAARTYGVGKISKEAELLIENTKKRGKNVGTVDWANMTYAEYVEKYEKTKTSCLKQTIAGRKFHELNRKLREELSSVDGAVIVDFDGTIIACGAIVRIEAGMLWKAWLLVYLIKII